MNNYTLEIGHASVVWVGDELITGCATASQKTDNRCDVSIAV